MEIKEMSDMELAAAEKVIYAEFNERTKQANKLGAKWLPYRQELDRRQLKAEIHKEMEERK